MNYYDAIADGYEELYREEQEKKITLIKENFQINKEDKVLDLGCGPGFMNLDCELYRVDPSEKLLDMAEGKKVLACAEDLPFPDNTFDKVISVTAMQNFSNLEKAVKEMKRVCHGKFAISFLKKSPKRQQIEKIIQREFDIEKTLEEAVDILIIANYK